jgi:hypothetical protein
VFEAVVAFLDQFISRGAAPDILRLRERLVSDPETRRLLEVQLPSDELSLREAIVARRALRPARRVGEPRLQALRRILGDRPAPRE